jgi:hypothetical protein
MPPPPVYVGYEELQPSPATRTRTGLAIGIAVACVVAIVAGSVAVFLLVRGDTTTPGTTVGQAGSATTLLQTVTSGSQTSSVDQTITPATTAPATPGTSRPGDTGASALRQAYLAVATAILQLLIQQDARMPAIADQINATAPQVPRSVYNELQAMMGKVDAAAVEISGVTIPAGLEPSGLLLDDAIGYMGERIQATIRGIEAMYNSGSVSAGTTYFAEGRTARDNLRQALQRLQESLPLE